MGEVQEYSEQKKRRKCIKVHNLLQPRDHVSGEDRKWQDISQVGQLVNDLGIDGLRIAKAIRLGHRPAQINEQEQDLSSKPHLFKKELGEESDKALVFRNCT